jgi:hypothetical protein
MGVSGRAAFFDVDGTLVRTNIVHAFAFYAMNQGTIFGTAWRTARTAACAPLYWALDKANRKIFNEVFYRSYEGMSEDRLVVLADELFEESPARSTSRCGGSPTTSARTTSSRTACTS